MSKKLFFLLPALFLGAFLMFTPGCGEADPCKDTTCSTTGGDCFLGDCVCKEGFEGTNCDAEFADKFVGSYLGFDNVTRSTSVPSGVGKYNLTKPAIVTKKTGTTISIANFGGFESFVDGTISKSTGSIGDKVTFSFTDPAGRKFVGTATYTTSTIAGTYVVTYSDGTLDEATFEYKK